MPKHKGLSAFAVPMHQPGIEQRPLRMINGITTEFGQVLFDGARVPAANMIGEPGEGWRLAMTIVSHEREPGELGYVARYAKTVKELEPTRCAPIRRRSAATSAKRSRGRTCRRRCCGCTSAAGSRSASTASSTGPGGSIDKLLMTWVEQTVGSAALAVAGRTRRPTPTTSR